MPYLTGGFNISIPFLEVLVDQTKKVYELSIEFHGEINPAVSILHNIFTFIREYLILLFQSPTDRDNLQSASIPISNLIY